MENIKNRIWQMTYILSTAPRKVGYFVFILTWVLVEKLFSVWKWIMVDLSSVGFPGILNICPIECTCIIHVESFEFFKLYACHFGPSMIYPGVNLCHREHFNTRVAKFVLFLYALKCMILHQNTLLCFPE